MRKCISALRNGDIIAAIIYDGSVVIVVEVICITVRIDCIFSFFSSVIVLFIGGMKMIYGYIRVSTEEQNFENQKKGACGKVLC